MALAECFGISSTIAKTDLKSGNICPLCAKDSILSPLGLMQLNLEEAIWICSYDKCPFPFTCGPVSNFIVSRNFVDMPKKISKRKPKKQFLSTSSVTSTSKSLSAVEPSHLTVGARSLPADQVSVSATSGFCSDADTAEIDATAPSIDIGAGETLAVAWTTSVRDKESVVRRSDRNLDQVGGSAQTFVSGSLSSGSCVNAFSSLSKFARNLEAPEIPSTTTSLTDDASHALSPSLPLLCVENPGVSSVLFHLKTCSERLACCIDGLSVAEMEHLLTMKCHWKTECAACWDCMESERAQQQTLTIRTCGQDFSPANPAVINTCVSCAGIGSSRVIWDEIPPPVVTYSFLSGTRECPASRLLSFPHARHSYEARVLVCMSADHTQRLWLRGEQGKV